MAADGSKHFSGAPQPYWSVNHPGLMGLCSKHQLIQVVMWSHIEFSWHLTKCELLIFGKTCLSCSLFLPLAQMNLADKQPSARSVYYTHTAIQSWVMCCPRKLEQLEHVENACGMIAIGNGTSHRYVQTTMKPKANLKKETSFRHVGSSAYTVPLGSFKKEVKPQRIQFAFNFPAFSSNAILRVPSIQPMMLWWQDEVRHR